MQKQLQYQTDAADWRFFTHCFLAKTKSGRLLTRLLLGFWIAGVLIVAGALALWHFAAGAILFVIIWTSTLLRGKGSITQWLNGKYVKKLAIRLSAGNIKGNRLLTISDDAVTLEIEASPIRRHEWKDLAHLQTTNQGVLLTFTGDKLLFVPGRAFESANTLNEFVQECRSHLPDNSLDSSDQNGEQGAALAGPSRSGRGSNGLAWLSLFIALAALVLTCFPIAALVAGVAALLLGSASANMSRRHVENPRTGMSMCAIALGGFAICIALLLYGVPGSVVVFAPRAMLNSAKSIVDVPLISALNEVQAASNASAIAHACLDYAPTHDGHFPPHLAVLLITKRCDVQTLQVPGGSASMIDSSKLPAAETDWPAAAEMVDRGSDFIYVGGDLSSKATGDVSTLIVAYGKGLLPNGTRTFAFADGTGKCLEALEANAAFDKCNQARTALNLPSIKEVPR